CDFPSIGNQDPLEHGCCGSPVEANVAAPRKCRPRPSLLVLNEHPTKGHDVSTWNNGWPYSTAVPSSTRISRIVPETPAGISLKTFIASTMHTTDSGVTLLP